MAKGKSDATKVLDDLQVKLRPALKERGFRVRGRAFNRVTSDGLTEVVQLQAGRFDPPGTTYFPGLRENLYGKFTVNLGVFVPEVAELYEWPTKSFVQEHYCCIRTRLSFLGQTRRDVWWNVRADEVLIEELMQRLVQDAIPFFRKFETRDAILGQWLAVPQSPDGIGIVPPRIICAIILARRGRSQDARVLLAAQVRETLNPGHPAFVRRLSDKLGLGELGS